MSDTVETSVEQESRKAEEFAHGLVCEAIAKLRDAALVLRSDFVTPSRRAMRREAAISRAIEMLGGNPR